MLAGSLPAPRVLLRVGEFFRCRDMAHLLARLAQADIERLVQDSQDGFALPRRRHLVTALLKGTEQCSSRRKARGMVVVEALMFKRGSLLSPYGTSPRFCAAQYAFV
jgi:hypothetical protein